MPSPSSSLRRARPLLGTLAEISVEGDAARLSAAADRAFAAIERVHKLMSFHDGTSDVSRLNREAYRCPIRIDRQTWEVLARAKAISEASHGAFDITVAPRLVEWGYLPKSALPLQASRPNGYQVIELLADHQVRFHEPACIDLGGIAKGYAVDAACIALEQCGVYNYVVNAGGDLRAGGAATTVHVRHPCRPTATLVLGVIQNAAVATSASYFARKRRDNMSVHPIIAPDAAAPARYQGSISVVAGDCMNADALTKVVAVLGNKANPVLNRFGAEAVLLSETAKWRRLRDESHRPDTGVERDAGVTAAF